MRLKGKFALITGGTSGIGLATARLFCAEGARVAVVGRNRERLDRTREALGERLITIQADVFDVSASKEMMRSLTSHTDRIDVLFLNAGISERQSLAEPSESAFDRMMSNVKSAYFGFGYALPLLAEGASVLLTGSVASAKGRPSDPLYAATKAAVIALAKNFAGDEAVLARRIRVNVLSPGAIHTPLTQALIDTPQVDQAIRALIPMRRWGEAAEVAAAALFLASSEASYITGSVLAVDGGLGQL